MKFNIVDRDTHRVVGAVSIDEGQYLNALIDREQPDGQVTVVTDSGAKYSFNNFGEAFAFALNGKARVKQDEKPYTDPDNLKAMGHASEGLGKGANREDLARLARFDNWHNTEGEARNQYGEFKCIFPGQFAIERLDGNQNNERFVAFNVRTGEYKVFYDEGDAHKWCYDSLPGTTPGEKLINQFPGNPFAQLLANFLEGA